MLFRRARQIGPAGGRGGAAPDDVLAANDRRAEHLVFEIAVVEPGVLGEPEHLARLGNGAGERLFAGHRDDLAVAGFHLGVDGLHHLEAGVVGRQDPDCIDIVGIH